MIDNSGHTSLLLFQTVDECF